MKIEMEGNKEYTRNMQKIYTRIDKMKENQQGIEINRQDKRNHKRGRERKELICQLHYSKRWR